MLGSTFFQMFWIVFIGLVGMLGISVAMVAGMTLALGEFVSALCAVGMTAACAFLCGAAQATFREASPPRVR